MRKWRMAQWLDNRCGLNIRTHAPGDVSGRIAPAGQVPQPPPWRRYPVKAAAASGQLAHSHLPHPGRLAHSSPPSPVERAEIEVPVPLEVCWTLWDDRERIPQWMPWIKSVKVRP